MLEGGVWRVRGRDLSLAEPIVMGILNVTPDSFSDGGVYRTESDAIARGLQMATEGARVVDVGGESTRPSSEPVDARTEIARVVPVVGALADAGVVVSIDTSKPEVAQEAIDAGAAIVNDVTGMSNPEMVGVAAASGSGVVIMHMQGTTATMQNEPTYDDVVSEVCEYLQAQAATAIADGIRPESVVVDPGIGFGKTNDHNLDLLRNLDTVVDLGFPTLVGTSRKGFLGSILEPYVGPTEPTERDGATAATTALAVMLGAKVVRVHNVRLGVDVAMTAKAMVPTRHGKEINWT